jgi:uncharacterized protein DUF11
MGRVRLGWVTPLFAAAVLAFGVGLASSDTTPATDFAVSLVGPAYVKVGDVATYTITAVNNGPDAASNGWLIRFGWSYTPDLVFVSADSQCQYVPAGNGNYIEVVDCSPPSQGIPVGYSQTVHVSLKWTQVGTVRLGASVDPAIQADDPNLNNDGANLDVLACPSGCTPISGGGGGGGPPAVAAPTPPPYAFAASLPAASQYRTYLAAAIPTCMDTPAVCPQTVALTSGSLPPGIGLYGDLLQGSPTTPGDYTFSLEGRPWPSDNYTTISRSYTVSVAPFRDTSGSGGSTMTLVLPKQSITPGVVNPAVRQATIRSTVCVANWTKKIRPPASYTDVLKLKQMKKYGETGSPAGFEEDQLIPLQLGGAPRNPKNLWPEPRSQSHHSDPLETALKRKVCHGTLTLAAARTQILAYKRSKG